MHLLFYSILFSVFFSYTTLAQNKLSLAGEWQVKIDSLSVGDHQHWAATRISGIPIRLPGTLDDAAIGTPNRLKPALNNHVLSNLTRKHQYIGLAWYQKEVDIPSFWEHKEIHLTLERVIWESRVFVDGILVGSAESLAGSHTYTLTDYLHPGKHLITIAINNSNQFPLINVTSSKYPDPTNQDMAHAYTNHTQIKWNGIIGDLMLEASEPNAPRNLQVYPDIEHKLITVHFKQKNPIAENILFELIDNEDTILYSEKIQTPTIRNNTISFQIATPKELQFWDEFNPMLYTARIVIGNHLIQRRFGYRVVKNNDGVLTLNGNRIFLRGNLECAIFPLTGYPPMKKTAWKKLITQAKNYGLNHFRFHSWCPPKAAFDAADEAGFYLQVELPHWSLKVGQDNATNEFLRNEAKKIIMDYGNHPSFLLMALGNELQGDITLLNHMVVTLKKMDNRHLYTTTSFSFQKPTGTRPESEDEFFITQWTQKGWVRGQGIFNTQPPHFDKDYSTNSSTITIPLISHEIGQYSVYPDLKEISKYTGVLKPLNFIAVRNDLEKKGLINLADDFTQASGKLAAVLYKEEIERALKTSEFDGFQLLQLQDFPGQGTALVGLLNAFWESKGIISAEEFRKFNSEIVPLIRFEKAIYEDGETFSAAVEIANFFKEKKSQTVLWSIQDEQRTILKKGTFENIDLIIGNNTALGEITLPVMTKQAKRLTVTVGLEGTSYENSWPIWIYPKAMSVPSDDILITSSFETAIKALQEGQYVFLNPELRHLNGIEGRFVPVFWSPVHFPDQPGTMGLLIDKDHKALQDFPTNFYTEWQWWDLCLNSKAVIIDTFTVKSIVRVIDNFVTNHALANVFEARVGKGKLVFSSIDLQSDLGERPVARQLRKSILSYMNSSAFDPSEILHIEQLNTMKKRNTP